MGHVVDGGRGHEVGGHHAEFHPRVLFDLADRGSDDVEDGRGCAGPPHLFDAGEDQQALGVSPDSGGEVVDAEQRPELVGVALLSLEIFYLAELAVDQRLGAAGQVDHDRVEVLAQQGLLAGDLDGRGVDLVECVRDLTDLVLALGLDGVADVADDRRTVALDSGHQRGQAGVGRLESCPRSRRSGPMIERATAAASATVAARTTRIPTAVAPAAICERVAVLEACSTMVSAMPAWMSRRTSMRPVAASYHSSGVASGSSPEACASARTAATAPSVPGTLE